MHKIRARTRWGGGFSPRPIFFVFMILFGAFSTTVQAADPTLIRLDDYYYSRTKQAGTFSFKSSSGGTTYTFPDVVDQIAIGVRQASTEAFYTCNGSELHHGSRTIELSPPTSTITCKFINSGDSDNTRGAHLYIGLNKTKNVQYMLSTSFPDQDTPIIPDTGSGGGDNGGGTNPPTGGGTTDPPDNGGGTTDPPDDNSGGTTPSCNGCDLINQIIACPGWSTIVGDLAQIMPSPPDWSIVADEFKSKIVPAIGSELMQWMPDYARIIGNDIESRAPAMSKIMGQEIVNRSPEIARIFADEFQSREKPVIPPPNYIPQWKLPNEIKIRDISQVPSFDLNSNVPNFEPDYSGSQGFTIPDPADWNENDITDKGYDHKTPTNTAPDYNLQDTVPENDIGYETTENTKPAPNYEITNKPATSPAPSYNTSSGSSTPPNYNGQHNGNIDYNHPAEKPVPDYRP